MRPDMDARPRSGIDAWGCRWENIGSSRLGEVKESPLVSWDDLGKLAVPDPSLPERWESLPQQIAVFPDRYIMAYGVSLYERSHYLRGLEQLWVDLLLDPDKVAELLDILVQLNLESVKRYAAFGVDGYFMGDDWGLQDRLMISPQLWRDVFKPCYKQIFEECHAHGMHTILHSCGYIVDILDDLIDIGLDVIQMDQQENMGLELLGNRFGGRITFWSPVDIQNTMASGDTARIRAYCHAMAAHLGRRNGGFIAKYYEDPEGVGHTPEAVAAMCDEFTRIGNGSGS
jgi:hypothetical protein